MAEVQIKVVEDDTPLYTFTVKKPDANGVLQAEDLTGATTKWVSKLNDDATDVSGQTINGVLLNQVTNKGQFTIQLTSAVTQEPGTYFYKVVVTLGGNPLTVQWGDLVVVNA